MTGVLVRRREHPDGYLVINHSNGKHLRYGLLYLAEIALKRDVECGISQLRYPGHLRG